MYIHEEKISVLVKVWKTGDEEISKMIVRGTKEAEFHPDIFAKVEPTIKSKGKASFDF